ncbi:AAA family ATPase [Candidatus Woesearchaeota archaeon]|nr:AAA family ATPase [Candidatus Woesearchaeota archaeon]
MVVAVEPTKTERRYFIELSSRVISENAQEYKCERLNGSILKMYDRILGKERSASSQGFASEYNIAFEAFERMLGTYKATKDELTSKYPALQRDSDTKRFINLFSFYIAAASAQKEISKHVEEAVPVQLQENIDFGKDYSVIDLLVEEYIRIGKGPYNAKELARKTRGYLEFFENFLRKQLERGEYNGILNAIEKKSIYNPDAELAFHGLNYTEVRKQRSGSILTFNDMGGNHRAKSAAYLLSLRLNDEEACIRNNIDIYEGILFEGPPGTGKTFLAKIIADTCGKNFVEVNLTDFMSKYWGESEERLRKILSVKNSIIFFDEIDAVCPRQGGDDNEGMMGRITNEVAKHLQGFQTDKYSSRNVYIAATNRRQLIDEKILRAGRFDKIISFEYPTEAEIGEILQIHLRLSDQKSEFQFFEDIPISAVASAMYRRSVEVKEASERNPRQKIQGLAGSDIKELVRRVRDFRWNAKYFGHSLVAATEQDFFRTIAEYEAEKRG